MEARRKRLLSSGNHFDSLPVEIVGSILSRLDCVRSVAMACMTCKAWQRAVKDWLFEITCAFPVHEKGRWCAYERTITGVVQQARHLREISIINGEISVCVLRYWLLQTRTSLKSFSFSSKTKRFVRLFILLAECVPNIEMFQLRDARISMCDLMKCKLPHLTSLTLDKVLLGRNSVEDLDSVFSNLLNLKHVTFANLFVRTAAVRVVLNCSPSLKTFNMISVCFVGDSYERVPLDVTFVLNAVSLSILNFTKAPSRKNMSLEVEQVKSLQHLVMEDSNIVRIRCRGSIERLDIWNAPIMYLDVKNLTSLSALTLFSLHTIWPLYLKIKKIASTKLRKLQLLGGLPTFSLPDLSIIVWHFPNLHWLSLYFQDTLLFGQHPKKLPVFRQLINLEVFVNNRVTDHNSFTGWVIKLLQCCPNLKRMTIKLEPRLSNSWAEEVEFPSKVGSLLKEAVRPNTHVRVCVLEGLHKCFLTEKACQCLQQRQ